MIRIKRTRLEPLGECRGYALQIEFATDVTDDDFEAFVDRFYTAIEPLRLVNLATRVTDRFVEISSSDVLGGATGLEFYIRDVRTALAAAGCYVDHFGVTCTAMYHPAR
jgi:hypothetical protein